MADGSAIEWTDATWQPITGCSVVSPGCTNCYAMKLAGTRLRQHPSRAGLTIDTKAGPVWNGEVRFNEQWLLQPLAWRKPRRIFVCAHGDLFHENIPDEWIDKVFAVMALCPQHTFQVLTKRAKRMREYLSASGVVDTIVEAVRALGVEAEKRAKAVPSGRAAITADEILAHNCFAVSFNLAGGYANPAWPLPNVWLGVSTERQQEADERIPDLLQTPAAVRFISAEPLLGPIALTGVKIDFMPGYFGDALQPHHVPYCDRHHRYPKLDWVIVGGESGPGARPMHPDWARGLRDQCATAGVPFFFKQWGAYRPNFPQYADEFGVEEGDMLCDGYEFPAEGVLYRDGHFYDGVEYQPHTGVGAYWMSRAGKKAAGRHLDGKLHDEFPTRENCNGV